MRDRKRKKERGNKKEFKVYFSREGRSDTHDQLQSRLTL